MAGFTKLFSSIVDSTIWRESKETKIVWITMLAKADRSGIVEAAVPGLADAARVSVPECRESVKILSSPDPDSRSKEHEGRRIKEIDGGWQILNYAKYREKLSKEERLEYQRQWDREHRKKSDAHPTVSDKSDTIRLNPTHAEADSRVRSIIPPSPSKEGDGVDFHAENRDFRRCLSSIFKRDTEKPWSYQEDFAFVALVKSHSFSSELVEVQQAYRKGVPWLPQSLERLLETWNGVLDKARADPTVGGNGTNRRKVILTEKQLMAISRGELKDPNYE